MDDIVWGGGKPNAVRVAAHQDMGDFFDKMQEAIEGYYDNPRDMKRYRKTINQMRDDYQTWGLPFKQFCMKRKLKGCYL